MKAIHITRQISAIFLSLALSLSLAACGGEGSGADGGDAAPGSSLNSAAAETDFDAAKTDDTAAGTDFDPAETDFDPAADEDTAASDSSILVAFFSHTGENHNVGVIEKGNTHIIAEMIAEETGADLFEIETVNPYPDAYDECTDVAKQEQKDNARPEIVDPPENLDGYDTVFIGYPIWWGDLPMAVYTFLESYDFAGKTLIPFCTHEGSGLSGTKGSIEEACSGATVLDGLAVQGSVAQNEREEARAEVKEWLGGLEI